MVLAKQKCMHLVLNMFIFTRTLVTYARTVFKPCCCLNFQSMRTQAESTCIAHNMFGQIKIKIPWYIRLRLRLHHYICLKGHLSGSLEKACNLTYVNKGEATMIRKRKGRKKV